MTDDARRLLGEADEERRVARWADDMRVTLRLGCPVKLAEMKQVGPFGRKREYLYKLDDRMPGDAIHAIYRALAVVRDEANAKAAELEARVNVGPSSSTSEKENQ